MFTLEEKNQLSFSDQFFDPLEDPIQETHPYIVLMKELPWDELLDQFAEYYTDDNGRPSIPVKNMIFLLLVKHREGYSDRELTDRIKVDIVLQKALNILFRDAQNYVHHSSFSKFRSKIGEQDARQIEEAVQKFVKKKAASKTKKVFVDTTVCPSNIAFPTDIHLLEKARRQCLKIIKTYSEIPLRTYSRTACRVFISYIKFRKARRQKTRVIHGKMIRFLKRNLSQAEEALESTMKDKKILSSKIQKDLAMLRTIRTMLEQQIQLHGKVPRSGKKSEISIPDRIVSIYKDYIRPIPRGKISCPDRIQCEGIA